MCQKDCLAQAPTRRQPHPLLLKATPTKHATEPRPSNTSNVGVSCGCGLILMIFVDSFPFRCYLPSYPILSSGSPEKQLIELVWPYYNYVEEVYNSIKSIECCTSHKQNEPLDICWGFMAWHNALRCNLGGGGGYIIATQLFCKLE